MKGHKKINCSKKQRLELENGAVVYEGTVYDGQPSGRGRLMSDDFTYHGEFLNGKKSGFGIQTSPIGDKYEGYWQNNIYHGEGRLVKSDASVHEGFFHKGKLHGDCTIQTANYTYRGTVYFGTYHGKGTLVLEGEGTYVGSFFYGVRHGHGVFTSTNGDIYNGSWRKGHRSGIGIHKTEYGTYTGSWSRDKRNGHGRFVSNMTGIYDGSWKRNLRHNQGTQNYCDGTTYTGGWSNGKKTGFGVQKWPNGDFFKGFWLDDTYNGRGSLRMNNCIFTGVWSIGKREDIFVETYDDGSSLTGPWLGDVRHGTFRTEAYKHHLFIWGECLEFESTKDAKRATIKSLRRKDYLAARVIAEFHSINSWTFLFENDKNGHLLHLISRKNIHIWITKHIWTLYKKKRYQFIQKLMLHCEPERLQRTADKVPELFDQLSHDFVPNPWIVHNVSYSESTKQKLLQGLHLGEYGRCEPLDPFTRQPLKNTSGKYLNAFPDSKARKLYMDFMKEFNRDESIQEIAYTFDLEDFEQSIGNARDAKDISTLKRLMKERNAFIQRSV